MKIVFDGSDNGPYRSRLEAEVAAELDRLGVEWRYEVRVSLPDGSSPNYLPDFTIDTAPDELCLPEWVEAKPQQMLYDLRDWLGVTRRCGENFGVDIEPAVEGATSDDLRSSGSELWKPKRLAEKTGGSVLVIGGVGGQRSLSVQLYDDRIVFSRKHPFRNWPGHQQRLERDEREAKWKAEAAARQEQWEAQRLAAQTKRERDVRFIVKSYKPIDPRYASECYGCFAWGDNGGLYRVRYADNSERWTRICPTCEASAWRQP